MDVQPGVDGEVLTPCVELSTVEDARIRAELENLAFVPERHDVGPAGEALLVTRGWQREGSGELDRGYELEVDAREVDRMAAAVVHALRDVHGCPHPLLLEADGLEHDDGWREPGPEHGPVREVIEEPAVRVQEHEELQQLVADALQEMFEKPLRRDDDGDIPIVCGSTVVWVEVHEERPVIELFAYLAVDVRPGPRVLSAVNHLNRRWSHARFCSAEDRIEARYSMPVQPFSAAQLRDVVTRFCDDIDDISTALVARVGGRQFMDRTEAPRSPYVRGASPALLGLLELLADSDVPTPTVATLFDHDRTAIVHQIIKVRDGRQPVGDLDEDLVVRHLRRALRHVADRDTAGVHEPPGH